mmetsp:Transcript_41407/g.88252  ORF Transcript_41407/g.88252 Transcript_41407/m.88252 type:complete len:264 (-) Transcript_41407:613-1404(-)
MLYILQAKSLRLTRSSLSIQHNRQASGKVVYSHGADVRIHFFDEIADCIHNEFLIFLYRSIRIAYIKWIILYESIGELTTPLFHQRGLHLLILHAQVVTPKRFAILEIIRELFFKPITVKSHGLRRHADEIKLELLILHLLRRDVHLQDAPDPCIEVHAHVEQHAKPRRLFQNCRKGTVQHATAELALDVTVLVDAQRADPEDGLGSKLFSMGPDHHAHHCFESQATTTHIGLRTRETTLKSLGILDLTKVPFLVLVREALPA